MVPGSALILLLLLPLHSKQFAASRLLRADEKVSNATWCAIQARVVQPSRYMVILCSDEKR